MRDIDLSLDPPAETTTLGVPPASAATEPKGDDHRPSSEGTESLEALYRMLIEKERRLITMQAELARRLEEQAERDRRLAGLVAPSEQRQQARYARLNEFLRLVMERTEQAAAGVLTRAETAAEQQRERALRDAEAWRQRTGRRLTVLAGTIAFLMMLQTAAMGFALWQSARGRGLIPHRVLDPPRTDPGRGPLSPASPP